MPITTKNIQLINKLSLTFISVDWKQFLYDQMLDNVTKKNSNFTCVKKLSTIPNKSYWCSQLILLKYYKQTLCLLVFLFRKYVPIPLIANGTSFLCFTVLLLLLSLHISSKMYLLSVICAECEKIYPCANSTHFPTSELVFAPSTNDCNLISLPSWVRHALCIHLSQ